MLNSSSYFLNLLPVAAQVPDANGVDPILLLVISSLIFLVLWAFMSRVFFRPFLKVVIEREERTSGDSSRADQANKEAAELSQKVERELARVRSEALAEREVKLTVAKEKASSEHERVGRALNEELKKERGRLLQAKIEAQEQLAPEVSSLASLILDKLRVGNRDSASSAVSRLLFLLGSVGSALLISTPAEAASADASITELIFPSLNFLIYLAIAFFLYKRFAPAALKKRKADYLEKSQLSAEKLREAEAKLGEARARSEALETKKVEQRLAIEQETERILKQLALESESDLANLKQDQQRVLKAERTKLERQVQEEIVFRAMSEVREMLAEDRISLEVDAAWREETIRIFEKSNTVA